MRKIKKKIAVEKSHLSFTLSALTIYKIAERKRVELYPYHRQYEYIYLEDPMPSRFVTYKRIEKVYDFD